MLFVFNYIFSHFFSFGFLFGLVNFLLFFRVVAFNRNSFTRVFFSRNFLCDLFCDLEINGESDEFWISLNHVFQIPFIRKFECFLFQMQNYSGSSERIGVVLRNGEGIGGWGFPQVRKVVWVFGKYLDFVGYQKSRIKSNSELADKVHIALFDMFNEVGGSWFG